MEINTHHALQQDSTQDIIKHWLMSKRMSGNSRNAMIFKTAMLSLLADPVPLVFMSCPETLIPDIKLLEFIKRNIQYMAICSAVLIRISHLDSDAKLLTHKIANELVCTCRTVISTEPIIKTICQKLEGHGLLPHKLSKLQAILMFWTTTADPVIEAVKIRIISYYADAIKNEQKPKFEKMLGDTSSFIPQMQKVFLFPLYCSYFYSFYITGHINANANYQSQSTYIWRYL
jgi:hypothetical protein